MKNVILFLLVAVTLVTAGQYSLLNLRPVTDIEMQEVVDSGCEIVHVYDDGSVDCVVNEHDYNALLATGIPFTIRIDDMERLYSSRLDGRAMGGYMTWSELSAWLDDLHDTFPAITSAPTSIGNTYQGRPQRVVKISSNNDFQADDPSMPNVWYDALIHSREPASMRNVRFFMLWLCENYNRDGFCGLQATWLLDHREIWCLPCNNVDGYVYNETQSPGGGGMHRKNMNFSAGGDGVDLNRNWSVGWGGSGSSGNPSNSNYRGTAALSEPESHNIDAFWQNHPPAEMHSTHTYGNILIRPWGYTNSPPPDDAAYDAHAEIMVQWGTGEVYGQSYGVLYASAGNTRDHSYGLYGAMSWNHETGGDFAGFWPSLTETVKLTRKNLRSYLVTAFLAGCPRDPHVPGTPVIENIGVVNPPFTIDWNDVSGAASYALQELSGYEVLLDNNGSSGPFTLSNWSTTSSHYHSASSSYLSNGTGTMTWTETAVIPENGGGRLSFWAYYSIPNGSCQGSVEVSTDGGNNWYYLQTFTRDDPNWRFNIHELDEWQGDTLSFRWETHGSSSDLYIDDIKVEVWQDNDFIDLGVSGSSYTFNTHPSGEFWYRAIAMDPAFGPGWPSNAVMAQVNNTGIVEENEEIVGITRLGHFSPNPASAMASLPVTISSASEGLTSLTIYDLAGREVADLSSQIEGRGLQSILWNCSDSRGNAVPGGIYFVVINAPDLVQAREIVVTGQR